MFVAWANFASCEDWCVRTCVLMCIHTCVLFGIHISVLMCIHACQWTKIIMFAITSRFQFKGTKQIIIGIYDIF